MSTSDPTTLGDRPLAPGEAPHGGIERTTFDAWRADPSRWRGRRAVHIPGAFADTAAVTTWTPDHLARRFSTATVTAVHVPWEAWSDSSLATTEQMELARFVDLLGTEGSRQIAQQPLERFAGLLEELDPSRMAEPPYAEVILWLGRETRTPLHYDATENLFVQVYGSKRFVVEPPDSPAGRYVHDAPATHISRVDPLAPASERFPAYDARAQQTVVVAAGDALYLPPGWFHDVSAPEVSISVSCFFGERLRP
jgi:hypothetical protein